MGIWRNRSIRGHLYALLLPAGLWGLLMLANGVVPFGNQTLLIWDANTQYIDFLAYFRKAMLGQADILYSLSKGMGGSMPGLYAYYLASPLNLLLLLFDESALPLAFSVLVWLKIALCGLTAFHFLHRIYGARCQALLFSTTYALMGFVAAYFWDVMWLDGVVLLPLIALGIRRIVAGQAPWTYLVWLAVALVANFYIGFMLCLFSALYFLYCLFTDGDRRQYGRLLLRFAGASLLAGGLGAALLVPTALAIYGEYGAGKGFSLAFTFALKDLPAKWMTGSVDYQQLKDGLPNVYIGIPMLALFLWYFTRASIPFRKRVASGALVLVWVVSFWVEGLNLFWHAMDKPNFFPFRYSFLLCFFMIELAWQGWQAAKGDTAKRERPVWLICAVATLGYFGMILVRGRAFLTPWTVVMDMAIWSVSAGLLYAVGTGSARLRRIAFTLLVAMQLPCLLLHGQLSITRIMHVNASTVSGYREASAPVQVALTDLRQTRDADAGIANRIEKSFYRTPNDALHFGYAGLSHFSSDDNKRVIAFLGKLGLRDAAGYAHYNRGTTVVNDSLLGVKYLFAHTVAGAVNRPAYRQLFSTGEVAVYENPDAFSLAVYVTSPANLSSDDPFANQNSLFEAVTGASGVFKPVVGVGVDTSQVVEVGNGQYGPVAEGTRASLTYRIPAKAGEYIYLSLGGWPLSVSAMLDGQLLDRFDADALADCALLPILPSDGEHVLVLSADGSFPIPQPLFYRLDDAVYRQGVAAAKANMLPVTIRNGAIRIDATGRQAGTVLLTVPYDTAGMFRWMASA